VKLNPAGFDLIKQFEGLRLEAYRCPAGVWTIGYGHTGDVREGMKITEHQADPILDVDLDIFERGVKSMLTVPLNENQFSALVSLAFNIGLGAFRDSTLLKRVNAGLPNAAAKEFSRWVHAKGKVLPGLVSRREAEAKLFLKPVNLA
jgi:lysozyme